MHSHALVEEDLNIHTVFPMTNILDLFSSFLSPIEHLCQRVISLWNYFSAPCVNFFSPISATLTTEL